MKISLGLVLALCLAGLQFVAVTFVVFSSYLTSERALLEHARGLLSDVGTNTIEHSKGFLKPASGAAELATRLAENEIVSSENLQELEKLLFQQLQIAPQFAGVFYGDVDGNFVYVKRSDGPGPFRTKIIKWTAGDRATELIWRQKNYLEMVREDDDADTYDPRTRPWYQQAKSQQSSIWTDPYIFFTSQKPGITVASPVFDGADTIMGVVGVDIEIDAISGFLSTLKIGNNGTALIVNRNGDVIAHPNQALIKIDNADGSSRFSNIEEIGDPIARLAFQGLVQDGTVSVNEERSSEFTYEGDRYVASVKPVISEELPWTIAIYAAEDDFTGGIKANRARNIWMAAGIALMTGAVGLFLANLIHRPVRAFAVRSALVSQGEIPASDPLPNTYRELERVNETLVHEIAERKKTQKEYGRTFELASRGMAQIEAETGRFLRVNALFGEVLGYGVDDLSKMQLRDIIHPDDAEAIAFFEAPDAPDTEFLNDTRCVRRDGGIVWAKVHAIMMRDDAGDPIHAVVTLEDLTESKRQEREIQQLNRDVNHTARVNMMGHMATSLAHELNQPLTTIIQNMDAALHTVGAHADEVELKEILQGTDRQAQRAGDIIRSLRDFVRKDQLTKTSFDFRELIAQTLHLVQPEAKAQGITISVSVPDLPPISGSRVQIAQVLVNLVRNAIEAIAEGDEERGTVSVAIEDRGAKIMGSVTDSGPGFAPGFDPFAKFETSKKDGMGLGLSICRTIIEAHGGQMWYEPDAQQTQFCFSLPIAKGEAK